MQQYKSLDKLSAAIETMEAQRAALILKERTGVIARIQQAIKVYRIKPGELRFKAPWPGEETAAAPKLDTRPPRRARNPKKGAAATRRVKNKNPIAKLGVEYTDGERIWRGRAKMPKWLIEHMAANEKSLDQCIKAA